VIVDALAGGESGKLIARARSGQTRLVPSIVKASRGVLEGIDEDEAGSHARASKAETQLLAAAVNRRRARPEGIFEPAGARDNICPCALRAESRPLLAISAIRRRDHERVRAMPAPREPNNTLEVLRWRRGETAPSKWGELGPRVCGLCARHAAVAESSPHCTPNPTAPPSSSLHWESARSPSSTTGTRLQVEDADPSASS